MHLPNLAALPPPLLQLLANLLKEVYSAKQSQSHSIKLMDETLTMTQVQDSFCIATLANREEYQEMPASILSTFKTYSHPVEEHDNGIVLEASLLASGFENAAHLSSSLLSVWNSLCQSCPEAESHHQVLVSIRQMLTVVEQAAKYLKLLKQATSTSGAPHSGERGIAEEEDDDDEDDDGGEEALEPPLSSLVQHLLSEQVERLESYPGTERAVNIGTPHSGDGKKGFESILEEDEEPLEPTLKESSSSKPDLQMEELCLMLSLVELVFPCTRGRGGGGGGGGGGEDCVLHTATVVSKLSEVFSHVGVISMLSQWRDVREELAKKHSCGPEAMESAQVCVCSYTCTYMYIMYIQVYVNL